MNKFDKERYNQLKMFDKEYHILSLSGEKKSTALVFFIKKKYTRSAWKKRREK